MECGIKGGLPNHLEFGGVSEVHGVRRHVANTRVSMLEAVPGEECLAMSSSVFDAAEAFGELRSVLHRLEL